MRLVGDGTSTNRAGIGARVTVSAGGSSMVKEMGGGYGLGSMQHDTVLFYGLGACDAVDSISVRWPNQALTTDTFSAVDANRMVELRQGDPMVHAVTLP